MRKGLIFLLGIVSFLGINTVDAEEIYLEYDTNVNEIKPYIDEIGYDVINNAINENIKYYNENFSSDYPYYFISLMRDVINTDGDTTFYVYLTSFDHLNSEYWGDYFNQTFYSYVQLVDFTYNGTNRNIKQIIFDLETNTISENEEDIPLFKIDSDEKYYNPYYYYYSNFDMYYKGSLLVSNCTSGTFGCMSYLKAEDTLYIPFLDDSTKYSVHNANTDFLVEPYHLYDDNDSFETEIDNYVSVNLNDYAYVALSLKDYSATEQFYTNMYVQGQLCLTPVYNYGMTEKTEYYSSYQVQRCSSYYETSTLTRVYILADDLKNNAIYYLKAYDTSKENIVKIDTSVFDITYITEENKDNPYVSIDGKNYPTIAYDSLTSTATKSEDEDYISGVTCQVGDFNCYNEYNPDNIFDNIFSSPLKFLEDIWDSVTSIFNIIGEFISLLPPAMQSFLYLSFMIAIILGLLKLIL